MDTQDVEKFAAQLLAELDNEDNRTKLVEMQRRQGGGRVALKILDGAADMIYAPDSKRNTYYLTVWAPGFGGIVYRDELADLLA